MTTRDLISSVLVVFAVSTARAAAPEASAPPAVAPQQPGGTDGGASARGPFRLQPKLPALEYGSMSHVRDLGFSADSTQFACCWTTDGTGETHCTFRVLTTGAEERLDDWKRSTGKLDPAVTDAMRKRVKTLGLTTRPADEWDFADLVVTWRVVPGRPDSDVKSAGGPTRGLLQCGGRVDGESPVYPIVLSEGRSPYYDRIHPEAIALSPDGRTIAFVAHAFAGEFSDSFPRRLVSAGQFAALVYNDTGFAHHKKGDYARAAALFDKATRADPRASTPAYNLACAFARLGDPRAEAALREAFARVAPADTEKLKAKARGDADLAAVRESPWFRALVGG